MSEYIQCTNERCTWYGHEDDRNKVRSKNPDFEDVIAHDMVCPKCSNDEFYMLKDDEYKELKRKENLVMPDVCPECGSGELYDPNPNTDPLGPYCDDCGVSIQKVEKETDNA